MVCVLPFMSYIDIDDKFWHQTEIWDDYMKVLRFVWRLKTSKLRLSLLFSWTITLPMLFHHWNGPLVVLFLHLHRSQLCCVSPSCSLFNFRYILRGKYTNYSLVWYNHWLASLLILWYYKSIFVASRKYIGFINICLLVYLHAQNICKQGS